ncbi:cytochrome b [Amaricoccus solimangrovi]|uniref:Cytochrome b n=1 Tax=Amaricoccus solimangrovi TaxID=2589815 RepID=A0A501WPD8_9RHOB|nr:cytochrome b/b6 domain-containing protein [Amaricoccus solimangrovi]TPE50195.1 cytochrome b [Amaricoccus solimangrovi]
MGEREGYSGAQIALHWSIAGLILFNYLYSDGMGRAFDASLEGGSPVNPEINPSIHVWVGVAVLVLVLLRFLVRARSGVPAAAGAGAMRHAAHWGHRLLYALMVLVPALGAVTWFGGIEATADLHSLLANALMIVAGGHAAIALFHHFVLRDRVIVRMLRAR